jgi:amidase
MNFQEYRQYDALGLAELIRKKEILSSEVLELAIARAEAVNPKLNAIIYPFYERARRQVAVTSPETPFAGVPFLLKDLSIELAGTPFSQGCSALRGNESIRTSEMVRRLEESGLVFLGKTNTPEFGLTPYTEPQAFGPTHNPWDLSCTPGGSSGGSAAAAAAGIVPLATGSDGGGSIRIPASCCGLFGLKPSRGRVSMGPQYGELWQGATMENCLSRSVRDSAALLDVIRGNMPGDPFPVHTPKRPYLEEVDKTPDTLHIGFSVDHPLGHQVDPECVEAVRKTAALLENLGHQVEEVPFLFQRRDLAEAFIFMIMGETAATVSNLQEHLGRPPTRRDVEPSTWALALLGRSLSAEQFVMAIHRWNEVARRSGEFHQRYDILLTPVTAMPPFQTGHLQPSGAERQLISLVNRFNLGWLAKSNIDQLAEKIFSYIPFTPLANMTGQPSMSVPLHWTEEGLPVGSMFTAPMGREDMLYRLAGQLERTQPWFDNIPALDKTSNAPMT